MPAEQRNLLQCFSGSQGYRCLTVFKNLIPLFFPARREAPPADASPAPRLARLKASRGAGTEGIDGPAFSAGSGASGSASPGMDARQHLNELLSTLGLPALDFDPHGCARVLFGGEVVVNFECESITGQLHLYSDLGPLPAVGREVLYRSLLEANLFGVQTRGATLSVDSHQGQVVLSRTVSVPSLRVSLMSQVLEDFVDCATYWQRLLAAEAAGTGPNAQALQAEVGTCS